MQLSEQAFQTPFPPLLASLCFPPPPSTTTPPFHPPHHFGSVAQSNLRGESSQDPLVTCEEASTRVAIWRH